MHGACTEVGTGIALTEEQTVL